MPRVTFIDAAGLITEVQVAVGDSVMDGALDNNIAGIVGQCGGGCTCVTCHCYVAEPWASRVPAAHPDELEMLEYALAARPSSRLACQIKLADVLDGLVVQLPERQL